MANNQHNEDHHIIPFPTLARVCVSLLALTALTVFTAKFMHLGHFAPFVAFLIAFIKAMLVISIFMGLKYDQVSNRMIFGTAFFFLALLYFFSAIDIWTRVFETSTL